MSTIDSENNGKTESEATTPKGARKATKKATKKVERAKKGASKPKADPTNKKAEVIAMLKRSKGATLAAGRRTQFAASSAS
jgi:hypothetical protein